MQGSEGTEAQVPRPAGRLVGSCDVRLWSLSQGGSACLGGGAVTQAVVEMHEGFLFVMSISDGSSLTVLASNPCDVGLVGYEMGRMVTRVGDVLTPALRNELRAALPR